MLLLLFVLAVSEACIPNEGARTLVSKGSFTYVCVTINDQSRALYLPTADEFTELHLQNSYTDARLGKNSTGSYITVSSIGARSFMKQYSTSDGRYFSILTAIISVKDGIVQGITWDDGCFLCSKSSCTANTYISPGTLLQKDSYGSGLSCFTRSSECDEQPGSCDLVIYVGWTGTDKDGRYLTSAGLRFSQFQEYSVKSYIESFKDRISFF